MDNGQWKMDSEENASPDQPRLSILGTSGARSKKLPFLDKEGQERSELVGCTVNAPRSGPTCFHRVAMAEFSRGNSSPFGRGWVRGVATHCRRAMIPVASATIEFKRHEATGAEIRLYDLLARGACPSVGFHLASKIRLS
jgi:hypothetical protein